MNLIADCQDADCQDTERQNFQVRGRLAPSPTGAQHLGNARTHLLAYWSVRQAGGQLLFRIDDLDSPRVKSWAVDQAAEDIRWLGIDWDDGPIMQSQHAEHYLDALETIRRAGRSYPCVCSRKDITMAQSAPHESQFRGEGIIYPGTCAQSPADVGSTDRAIPTQPHCWRFRVSDEEIKFKDFVLGDQSCVPATELGDFPIAMKTGQATYQIAVTIDDSLGEVNQVVRGNDLIASTFRQIDLQQTLGLPTPQYAHVPLVRGADGHRLAKRHGDTRLSHYRDQGVSAEAIVGWAAHSLGLIDRNEPCQASELVEQFDWAKIPTDDTVVDQETLFG